MSQLQLNDNPTALLRQMHRWRMAFFGLTILIAGLVIGGSLALLIFKPEPPEPPMIPPQWGIPSIHQFKRHLNLTREQDEEIQAVLHTYMENMRKIALETRPAIMQELKQMKEDISAILTEEQRHRWQRQMERFQRESMGRPGGGGWRGGQDGRERPRFRGGPGGGADSMSGGGPGFRRRMDDNERGPFGPGMRRPRWADPNMEHDPNRPRMRRMESGPNATGREPNEGESL